MDVDAVVNSLKQLLIGSGKFIEEAPSFEQAEERIRHLEENDEQFHRYELVKFLKAEIESCIGPMVEEELERCSESGHEYFSDTEALVNKVTEKVRNSIQFEEMQGDISRVVQESVEKLCDNLEEEFRDFRKEESPPATPKQKDPYQFSDDDSTLSGSYNQASFMFVTHEQLKKNIEHLDKKNNIQTRRAALNDLIHMSLNDVLTNDESYQRESSSLQRGLIDALAETDDELLPKVALKFISRGLSTGHGNSMELYCTLTKYLYEFYSSKRVAECKVKNGLDLRWRETDTLLRAMRQMNDYQRHIPNYWVRYPTRFLTVVLEETLKLVAVGGGNSNVVQRSPYISAVHMLTIFDPTAEWFMKWTHGCYSRLPLLDLMCKYTQFLESVVRSILEFVASRRVPFDLVSEASESFTYKGTAGSHQQRVTYTGDELEYLYFIHSMNIIARLLVYKKGLKLFPVKVRGYDDEITVTKLVCSIAQLVTNQPANLPTTRSLASIYDPSTLASDVLKKLCSSESTYKTCLCNDEVTRTLLTPITNWLDTNSGDGSLANETTYRNIADILALMASKSEGRRHLLYGQYGDTFSRARSSAAHTITDFTKKALNGSLPVVHGQAPKSVADAYMFVCRQFFNNGEGLQAIYSYDLHSAVTRSWNEAKSLKSQKSLSVKPSYKSDHDDRVWWEKSLRDHLLNFSTTSKGVLLMHLSGAMSACAKYLYQRHKERKQVSKLEKFGYGSLITQIAGSPYGMLELEKHGLISVLCSEAWDSIEPGEGLEVPFEPKIWSVDAIDKSAHKPLVSLIHVFSSFTSVFELIGGDRLPANKQYTFRDKPNSLMELIDRIISINVKTDLNKIHFLFNYEQSHTFGLRLLNSLLSCLDTLLLMESQFKISETLIDSQKSSGSDTLNGTIIDQLTMERSHVLARCLIIGGPSERILPLRTLAHNYSSKLSHPIINSHSLPKEYTPNIAGKSSMKQENELSKFLNDSKHSHINKSWLDNCRTHLRHVLSSKPDVVKGNLLWDLLEKSVAALNSQPEEALFTTPSDSDGSVKNFKLTSMQELGVRKAVDYGSHLKLISNNTEVQKDLTKLLRQTGFYLKQQQRQIQSEMKSVNHNYNGYDWFVSTVFILTRGNRDKAWKFLAQFSNLASSAYMWSARMHRSIHLPPTHVSSGIMPVTYSVCHNVELILQVELPLVYSAFRMSGYAASQICQLWLRQCFWNFLDWTDITHYIVVCLVFGIDYQIYMCVSILKHLQKDILSHQQQQQLAIFLKENPIKGFKVSQNVEYMQQLEKKFRRTVMSDILNFTKP